MHYQQNGKQYIMIQKYIALATFITQSFYRFILHCFTFTDCFTLENVMKMKMLICVTVKC